MNVAIIGCNSMGSLHADMATGAGFTVVACCDRDRKTAASLAKTHGAATETDSDKVFARSDVDAVCIATPTPSHRPLVEAAAAAGKHIFCEKPFARTSADAKAAQDAAKKAGVKLFVGHVVRYFQEFDAMKARVEAGKIGKAGFAKLYRGGICPVGAGNWFRDFDQSGGVTFDCSIHDFDWLRYVFGDVKRVYSQSVQRQSPVPMDYSMTTLRMKNGFMAHVIGTWAHPEGFRVKAEICGSGGMIQFDSAETPLEFVARKEATGDGPSVIVPGSPVDVSPYQLEWEDFRRWIEGTGKPRVRPKDGVEAVRIAEAALESAKTGKAVTL